MKPISNRRDVQVWCRKDPEVLYVSCADIMQESSFVYATSCYKPFDFFWALQKTL
ncbi:hypothetical protein M758_6G064600 [Ceratodon purpureus]|uniref:Uncharacterized protein n=1 Tax=Ceratodon purpureus TaxID=3225 RepID=A0A8T0HD01_CERPU|nr:hypothetical protein KC19_6G068700 [Ceratodon purpureus]KAG0612943.1 hypothetical protein M758_6G064600 [Ceratodon purpureus]